MINARLDFNQSLQKRIQLLLFFEYFKKNKKPNILLKNLILKQNSIGTN